jgi:hypothetical protein
MSGVPRVVEVAAIEFQLGVDRRWGPASSVDWRRAVMEVVMGETGDKEESEPRLSLWRRRRLIGVTGSGACEVDAMGGGLSAILRFFPLFRVCRATTIASDPSPGT